MRLVEAMFRNEGVLGFEGKYEHQGLWLPLFWSWKNLIESNFYVCFDFPSSRIYYLESVSLRLQRRFFLGY